MPPFLVSRLRFISVCVLALGGSVLSCAGILGFERLHEDGGFVLEASTDDGSDEAASAQPDASNSAGVCGTIGIPDEPTDAGAGVVAPVLFALRTLDFGVDLDGGTPNVPGFNLDRTCSVDLSTSSCTTNVLESTFDNAAKDKSAAGLDNAGFTLIEYITGFSDLLAASTLNAAIADGRYGGVFRLTGWNGQPEDIDAQVELFPALAFDAPTDGGATSPTFTATDRWVLDARFQLAPLVIASTVVSQQAYVTGGQLVARFAKITVPIKLTDDPKPFDIIVEDGILQGTLVTTNGLTALTNTTIAGRWKTSDFLGQVRTIHIANANGIVDKDLCEPDFNAQLIYGQVKANVCNARDIRSDSQDNAQLPCDAVSAALKLEAYAIDDLGDFDAGPVIPPRCTADADVPANDDCTL